MTEYLVNGDVVLVEMGEGAGPHRAEVPAAGRAFILHGSDPERVAQNAWLAAHPEPSPERVEAMRLAAEREEVVCEHCGGLGGWRGWPGFTCHRCDGRRTVAA